MEKQPASNPASRQRLDKWLFFTRLIKSRSLAQKAIEGGRVAVNDERVTQSSFQLKTGDMLELALDRRSLIVRVVGPGERRGPYEEARLLYDDLTPEQPKEKLSAYELATRERGAGRPTKKERRETDRLKPDFDPRED
ncbi:MULTISPECIES: RNA-binding S4 domain-containing protein [Ensifer]|uniref:RNA-binding S4 domain-containing protein n=1 Tax=Ensifer adhaerens TaxID=106592 RepID=A0ABY8HE31_ENSAD|nr:MULTISPECIES: RNA-binding S4 domain-containing protein [Ensifer]ANK74214.1 RNA-binding protein [Ensifer adhaerens]KDP71516.1 RNA-binding protein S4 [Ensifer adhaerens]KQX09965.1 RNA-binding protein [Ensifer sp. Root423]KQZ42866.1 RNA-binding protein [Ensifer sp. Root558]MBD9521581.1 RNA-binding S4 domain-containing protein [Ensifer sp. ENS02]